VASSVPITMIRMRSDTLETTIWNLPRNRSPSGYDVGFAVNFHNRINVRLEPFLGCNKGPERSDTYSFRCTKRPLCGPSRNWNEYRLLTL